MGYMPLDGCFLGPSNAGNLLFTSNADTFRTSASLIASVCASTILWMRRVVHLYCVRCHAKHTHTRRPVLASSAMLRRAMCGTTLVRMRSNDDTAARSVRACAYMSNALRRLLLQSVVHKIEKHLDTSSPHMLQFCWTWQNDDGGA